jgi:signal recognition particle receptor subunit beta
LAHLTPDKTQVNARIVYWGIPGAGVSTNLRVIHDKLRSDHRGELQAIPTRLDPSTSYELLPIELGQVNGLRTQLHVVAVPAGPEHAPTRKQLLDQIDGLVLVVDSSPERADANVASLAELRGALEAYGRKLEELPVVIQYNKHDESDPYAIEELHRRLELPGAAVFEASARGGKGVLQTLTTISKRVVRVLRDSELTTQDAEPASPAPSPPSDVELIEGAILAEGESMGETMSEASRSSGHDLEDLTDPSLDQSWQGMSAEPKGGHGARIGPDFEIVSVGTAARASQRSVQVPIVLGNPEGETVTLQLTIALDPLLDPPPDAGDV